MSQKPRIATRNGEPAWMKAPPRLRSSHFEGGGAPLRPMANPGFFRRLIGWRVR